MPNIPKIKALKEALIYVLYIEAARQGAGRITISEIVGRLGINIGETLVGHALERAHNEQLIRLVSSSPLRWAISEKGIEFIEKQLETIDSAAWNIENYGYAWLLSESAATGRSDPDAWLKPDELGEKDEATLQEIRKLLNEISSKLDKSNLNQSEKAQVAGTVSASRSIAEMPTPKLGIIKRLLTPLSNLASIAELVKRILALLS